MLKSFFSVSYRDHHKIINILGIKFKFRVLEKGDPNITGYNNKLVLVENGVEKKLQTQIPGLFISICGNNNTVELELPFANFKNCKLIINGDNNSIKIGASNHLINNTDFAMSVRGGGGENSLLARVSALTVLFYGVRNLIQNL